MTQDLASAIAFQVRSTSGRSVTASTPMEVWQGLSACVVGRIADDWQATDAAYKAERQEHYFSCLLYTSPSPRDLSTSRMPSSA